MTEAIQRTLLQSVVLFVIAVFSFTAFAQVPRGWVLKGSTPKDYVSKVVKDVKHSGSNGALLASKSSWKRGFGTLMQNIQAEKFRGKRVRLSAWLKTSQVSWWAGLWMRVDGKPKQILAFDNMQRRPVRGTNDWKQYTVVLDVAKEATKIAFGVLLAGKGKVWIDSLKMEVVSKKVASTNQLPKPLPKTPQNLGFEK